LVVVLMAPLPESSAASRATSQTDQGKHDVSDADIAHAWRNAIPYVEFEYVGEERLPPIGPDVSGATVELVAVP
jgi:hypothetical protein